MHEETQETIIPGRGSPESAMWFREQLAILGMGNGELAREMIRLGDDRQFQTTLRTIQRMATGHARVSGEMRAFLKVLQQARLGIHQAE